MHLHEQLQKDSLKSKKKFDKANSNIKAYIQNTKKNEYIIHCKKKKGKDHSASHQSPVTEGKQRAFIQVD